MVHVSIRFWNVYRMFCHLRTFTILAVRLSKNGLDERMNDTKTVDLHSRTANCTFHADILLILYCIALYCCCTLWPETSCLCTLHASVINEHFAFMVTRCFVVNFLPRSLSLNFPVHCTNSTRQHKRANIETTR